MSRRPIFTDSGNYIEKTRKKRVRVRNKNIFKLDGFELIDFSPKTKNQARMFDEFHDGKNILSIGSAGSGKTVVSLYLALQKLIDNGIDKIIIVRSAVPTRNQGFLPGDINEKQDPYKAAYVQLLNFLFQSDTAWDTLIKRGYIQFASTSYIRSITYENSIIIFDEIQNADFLEIISLLTRLGEGCRVFLCGDIRQNDLQRRRELSGFNNLLKLIENLEEHFSIIEFTRDDIVRSKIVKDIIITLEDLNL